MKEYRMSVKLSSRSNSTEVRNNLALIQIVQEGQYHRAIGIEQLIEAIIIDGARREENRAERVSVSRLIGDIRRLFAEGWRRRIFNRFSRRNMLFRVQVWNSEEPDAPPIRDRRRKKPARRR